MSSNYLSKINNKNYLGFSLLLILSSSISIRTSEDQYLIFGIYLIISAILFIYLLSRNKLKYFTVDLNFTILDLIPALMIFIWIYGILIGIVNDNDYISIVRNNAGMVFYLTYFLLIIFRVKKSFIYKIVLAGVLFNVIYSYIYFMGFITSGKVVENLTFYYKDGGIAVLRSYYSIGLNILYVPISILLYKYIVVTNRIDNSPVFLKYIYSKKLELFISAIIIFSLLGTTLSKGFIAAFIAMALIYSLIAVNEYIKKINIIEKDKLLRKIYSFLIILFLIVIFISLFYKHDFANWLNSEINDTSIRNIQRHEILKELSIPGKGFGAALESGYLRDARGYGFELSYENLIHKIGIFSILVFLSFIATVLSSIYKIIKKQDVLYSCASLGAMMYLIPSIGNPILFSPICVILHCFSLYWLKNENIRPEYDIQYPKNPIALINFNKYINKYALNPAFIYAFIWIAGILMATCSNAAFASGLSNKLVLFILLSIITFFILSYLTDLIIEFYYNRRRYNLNNIINEEIKYIKLCLYILLSAWLILYIVNVVYSGGLPLIWRMEKINKTYVDYGVPSLNGLLVGIRYFLTNASLIIYLKEKNKNILFILIILLSSILFELNRGALIYTVIQLIGIYVLYQNINVKKITMIGIILLFLVILFSEFAYLRGSGDQSEINHFLDPSSIFLILPRGFFWVFAYWVTPIFNLNAAVLTVEPSYSLHYTFIQLVPSILRSDMTYGGVFPVQPVTPEFTASTFLSTIYVDSGFIGCVFYLLIYQLIICFIYHASKKGGGFTRLIYTNLMATVVLSCYYNYLLSLPTIFYFVLCIFLYLIFRINSNFNS